MVRSNKHNVVDAKLAWLYVFIEAIPSLFWLNVDHWPYTGNLEYKSWVANRGMLDADAKCVTETQVNFITNCHSRRRRRWQFWTSAKLNVVLVVYLHFCANSASMIKSLGSTVLNIIQFAPINFGWSEPIFENGIVCVVGVCMFWLLGFCVLKWFYMCLVVQASVDNCRKDYAAFYVAS